MTGTDAHQASEALGLWEPKRTLTLEAARRHSRNIKIVRGILFGLSALLVGVLIWQFASQSTTEFPEDNPNESVRMINPRYSGRTDDGLPYFLTAAEAIRTTTSENIVDLVDPVLHFFRVEGAEESTIIAATGEYDDVAKVLNLKTTVELTTDDGNHCTTTHARIFAQAKTVEGDEPIQCVGNFGSVNGNAYEILENYTVFVFKDGMDALLEQDKKEVPEGDGALPDGDTPAEPQP